MATSTASKRQTKSIVSASMLRAGSLPVEELAFLAAREGKRPRPIYGAHKWFARRAGSSFRALLVASAVSDPEQFWSAYYGEADLSDVTVLDPFVGGGTSVVEAARLGATAVGTDIDAIACAVTAFELASADEPDPTPIGEKLACTVGAELADYYLTTLPSGEEREVLHFFWVQSVRCGECDGQTDAHPHFRLAHEVAGTRQWVFCKECGEVHELPKHFRSFTCRSCRARTQIDDGHESGGVVTCAHCETSERLIDHAQRSASSPEWRLFAIESIPKERPGAGRVHMAGRVFSKATAEDHARFERARCALSQIERNPLEGLDDEIFTENRSDERLVKYGYERYRDLFNDRQQLHLATLFNAISSLPADERTVASIAFSDHLTKNCMLTCYAFGWRRLVPLFAFRAYRHITRPVEVNPWLSGVGRGTYPNAIKQSARAIDAAKNPTELLRDGGELPVPARRGTKPMVFNAVAQELPLVEGSVDLVMTDPPYFDNIDYSELADFYRPWMRELGLLPEAGKYEGEKSLASKGRTQSSADDFSTQLELVADELSRVLQDDGVFAFTFRHNLERGWRALSEGLWSADVFRCVQVFPLLAEGSNALHTKQNSGVFDAVFVLRKGQPSCSYDALNEPQLLGAAEHAASWGQRLSNADLPIPFQEQDQVNFGHACKVAAALGMFD